MAFAHTHQITLRTVSPVHIGIGRGNEWSNYADYVQTSEYLHFIDARKLEECFKSDTSLIDEYVQGMRSMDNTQSNFRLEDFIRTRLQVSLDDVTRYKIPFKVNLGKNQIRPCLTNAGKPYIAGSTLKGMIRTAVYYQWLMTTTEGKEMAERVFETVKSAWRSEKGNVEQAQQCYRDGDKTCGNDLMTKVIRSFENRIPYFKESALFGDLNSPLGPDFRHLRVSDTTCLTETALEVTPVMRVKLSEAGMTSDIPQYCMAIGAGQEMTFDLSLTPQFKHRDLQFLNAPDLAALMFCLQSFADASYSYELSCLDRISDKKLDGVYNFCADLEDEGADLETGKKAPHSAYCRIGFGKTYFDNSIGLMIHKQAPHLMDPFRKMLGLGRSPQTRLFAQNFPKTRSYVVRDENAAQPMGWCLIEKQA